MTKNKRLDQSGVLSEGTTGSPPASPSTNAGSQSMLGTSASIAQTSPSSQLTPNSTHAKMIQAFAAKLGALVEWKKITLSSGRVGYALFFDVSKWEVDPVSKALRLK